VPFTDKNLTCADCGQQFVFSAEDQEFYASRGFSEPKRCRNCRSSGVSSTMSPNAPQRITSGGDGLAIDSEGRVYTCTVIGIQVFSPEGRHLGTIALSRPPQNMAFAGPDKKTLYVVGRGAAYKIQMLAQGFLGRAK